MCPRLWTTKRGSGARALESKHWHAERCPLNLSRSVSAPTITGASIDEDARSLIENAPSLSQDAPSPRPDPRSLPPDPRSLRPDPRAFLPDPRAFRPDPHSLL